MPVDRFTAAIVVLLVLLVAIVAFNPWAPAPASSATTGVMEFKVVRLQPQFAGNSEATLNQMGAQGWDIAYGVGEYLVMKRSK